MAVRASEVVSQARSWLGTPFHHQGRLKGTGVDCAGLLIGVGHELGLSAFDFTAYSRQPDPEQMGRLLGEHLIPIHFAQLEPGSVIWFKFRGHPWHLAIKTDRGMIHSYYPNRRVVEHGFSPKWVKRIHRLYAIPGVEYQWQR